MRAILFSFMIAIIPSSKLYRFSGIGLFKKASEIFKHPSKLPYNPMTYTTSRLISFISSRKSSSISLIFYILYSEL